MNRNFGFGLALLCVGCVAKPPSPVPGASAPVNQAAASAPRGLEAKKIVPATAQPHFDLAFGSRHLRIGEGRWAIPRQSAGWNRMYGWGPVVWVTEGTVTRVLDLREEFPSHFVSQVYESAETGKIFLFLESGIEGPSAEYAVWISDDRGEHWLRGGNLVRPGDFPGSSLTSFFLDAAGNGTAWLRLEAAAGNDVYFRVTTGDGGRTWLAEGKPAFTSILRGEAAHP